MHQPTALLVALLCEKPRGDDYLATATREIDSIVERSLGRRVSPNNGARMLDTSTDLAPLTVSGRALLDSAARLQQQR